MCSQVASPSCTEQFWCDPPVNAEADRSWRLVHWWCCRRNRPAALDRRPPVLYPGSSHLGGRGTQTHLTASESNERERERGFTDSCHKANIPSYHGWNSLGIFFIVRKIMSIKIVYLTFKSWLTTDPLASPANRMFQAMCKHNTLSDREICSRHFWDWRWRKKTI